MKLNELCAWLRANSSGVYRPAAEAADEIERQSAELAALRADAVRMRGLLEACGIAMKLHTDSRVPTDWKYMIAAIDAAMAAHKEQT